MIVQFPSIGIHLHFHPGLAQTLWQTAEHPLNHKELSNSVILWPFGVVGQNFWRYKSKFMLKCVNIIIHKSRQILITLMYIHVTEKLFHNINLSDLEFVVLINT